MYIYIFIAYTWSLNQTADWPTKSYGKSVSDFVLLWLSYEPFEDSCDLTAHIIQYYTPVAPLINMVQL